MNKKSFYEYAYAYEYMDIYIYKLVKYEYKVFDGCII